MKTELSTKKFFPLLSLLDKFLIASAEKFWNKPKRKNRSKFHWLSERLASEFETLLGFMVVV
jgi:hypothetical protein